MASNLCLIEVVTITDVVAKALDGEDALEFQRYRARRFLTILRNN